ncbi:hypothetical protein [Aestuariivivens sediminis]|uniref:hypothetical protein n=1 Tax=Aestuariivivens sediminis TaxID=2913557 RepID=UPI001F56E0FA|nr:hypothetical protein [Aestuariivivens sediminis]
MIVFTIIGIIILGILVISFLMGMAGKPATPILNAIDKAAGIENPNTTKEIFNELQNKIQFTIHNIENTRDYQGSSITDNSLKLAKLLIDAQKYQIKIYAEEKGKMHLSKVFSQFFDHPEMKTNHENKAKNLCRFIEGNFRDGIKMEFIIKNAKEMCESYIRQYAQKAYKMQSVDEI